MSDIIQELAQQFITLQMRKTEKLIEEILDVAPVATDEVPEKWTGEWWVRRNSLIDGPDAFLISFTLEEARFALRWRHFLGLPSESIATLKQHYWDLLPQEARDRAIDRFVKTIGPIQMPAQLYDTFKEHSK